MSTFKFEWITDWETIYSEPFQQQWFRWCENAINSHVFFHPALCMAWIETYRSIRNIKPAFCIARFQDTVIFLPLVLWIQNWRNACYRLIIPVGYSDFDYHDPLVNTNEFTNEIMPAFWVELKHSLPQRFYFDSFILDGLRQYSHFPWFSEVIEISSFAYIGHFCYGGEFLQSLNTKLRGDIRRQIRRLQLLGNLHLITYKDPLLLEQSFTGFMERHTHRWSKAYKAPDFHHNLIYRGLPNGPVHFSELKVGEQTLSWHLGFLYNRCYYYYMPAINQEWQNYSPGKIHLFKLIEDAIEKGTDLFDFLRGEEKYKTGWSGNTQEIHQIDLHLTNMSSCYKRPLLFIKNKLF